MAEIMSEEGFKAILAEIQYLESVERPKASQAIAEARDKGDLSENAEYDAAKDAQGKLEARIALLKDKVANARIIDATKLSTEKIQIMSKVRLLNHKLKKEVTYTIVSESEANFMEGKISVATPIAKALLNHVRAWNIVGLNPDRTNLIEGTTIETSAFIEHTTTHSLTLYIVEVASHHTEYLLVFLLLLGEGE